MREQTQPLAQKAIDLLRAKAVADPLQTQGVGAAQNAIVERLEGDDFPRELPLGVFVAVQAELGVERKVAAELEEEWPEAAVDGINVLLVHHPPPPHDPSSHPPPARPPP